MDLAIDASALGASDRPLSADECAGIATRAAALLDLASLDGAGDRTATYGHSPPPCSIGHYELVDGELRRTSCSLDDESPPSSALTAALGHQ